MVFLKQKLAYIAAGILLTIAFQVSANWVVSQAGAQESAGGAERPTRIKYVYAVDYPLGQKAAYLAWVKSVAGALQAPGEIKRVASYDNYFGASPHRVIEFEFDHLADAATYFERPAIKQVLEAVVDHGLNPSVQVLVLRGDYNKQ